MYREEHEELRCQLLGSPVFSCHSAPEVNCWPPATSIRGQCWKHYLGIDSSRNEELVKNLYCSSDKEKERALGKICPSS